MGIASPSVRQAFANECGQLVDWFPADPPAEVGNIQRIEVRPFDAAKIIVHYSYSNLIPVYRGWVRQSMFAVETKFDGSPAEYTTIEEAVAACHSATDDYLAANRKEATISPLPWGLYRDGVHRFPGIEYSSSSVVIWGDDGEEAGVRGETHAQALANAKFIVKACNLHEELLEFVRYVDDSYSDLMVSKDKSWLNTILEKAGAK